MNIPRIMIAAPKSGSGKTLITCGLLGALKNNKKDVVAFKCGPDYIDPMFHRNIQNVETENLDTFFTNETDTQRLFIEVASQHDFAVIEGVMGLFDGLGGVREEGSAYHLAKVTKTPIVLVVDVHGMGKSMIPFIKGFEMYDEAHLIKGIILNRITEAFYETMKPLLEKEIHAPVVGYFPNRKDINLESRHLGLVLPEEIDNLNVQLNAAVEQLQSSVSIDKIIGIGQEADELEVENKKARSFHGNAKGKKLSIAVARDNAFCFYYQANIRELQKYGVKIKYFSPLSDEKLPADVDGLLLGGGYPELYGERLSDNTSMKESIKQAINQGIPLLAECGGFMYLHEELLDENGKVWPMVGAVSGITSYMGKLVRFGYVDIEEKTGCFLKAGTKIKAHEFHYYDSTSNGTNCIATKPTTGRNWECIHSTENTFIGFPHLYYPSAPEFVEHFVQCMMKYSSANQNPA